MLLVAKILTKTIISQEVYIICLISIKHVQKYIFSFYVLN